MKEVGSREKHEIGLSEGTRQQEWKEKMSHTLHGKRQQACGQAWLQPVLRASVLSSGSCDGSLREWRDGRPGGGPASRVRAKPLCVSVRYLKGA